MRTLANKPDASQNYVSDFDSIFPYSKIRRCLCNPTTGEIGMFLSHETSNQSVDGLPVNLSDGTYDVMVYIPAFYYKVTFSDTQTKYSILQDEVTSRYKGDYEVHPAFINENGGIRPYILVGAFKGVESGGKLRSIAGQKPTVSKTISAFRDLARQGRSTKFNINTVHIVSAIQMLYVVEFANLNSQAMLGNGWTGKSESAVTGSTAELGNRSGYLGVNGNQISYRGMEDFFGNIWEFVDGLLIKDDGYYMTNNPAYFGNASNSTRIGITPLTDTDDSKNGYVTSIERNRTIDYCFFPNATGGSESTYYCDYFWAHDKGEENIAFFGAYWGDGSLSGAFSWDWGSVASDAWADLGSRLVFLP